MNLKTKIFFGLYFLLWVSFLVILYLHEMDKYEEITFIWFLLTGIITAFTTIVLILSIIIKYIFKPGSRYVLRRNFAICLSPLLFLSPLAYKQYHINDLEAKKETITLSYISWACDCANWVTPEQMNKYSDNIESLSKLCVNIEAADKKHAIPYNLYSNNTVIKLTGKFYKYRKLPNTGTDEFYVAKARTFRYDSYKVISDR
jgi:hypothetical protein